MPDFSYLHDQARNRCASGNAQVSGILGPAEELVQPEAAQTVAGGRSEA